MIGRLLSGIVSEKLFKGKVVIVLGARQTGKTTLLKMLQHQYPGKSLFLDCDDPQTRALLQHQSTPNLKRLISGTSLLIIDEAQRVENIGLSVKQIHDHNPECQLVVSGSSALELSNSINEPLTGRKWEYQLFPLSFQEMAKHHSWFEETRLLETRLVYGSYPDVINHPGDEPEVLRNLTSSYLYKDIFNFQDIRKPQILEKILQLLAFQLAAEVSYNELANELQVSINTVSHYIDLLEKSYVVFRLPSLSRNLRNEVKRSRKVYFYDNGIRNSIISAYNPIGLRQDVGQLWENYLVAERMKKNAYQLFYGRSYFWRTIQQQEIDYIEEMDGQFSAYEFKYSASKKASLPKTFSNAYPNSRFQSVNTSNYTDFIGDK